MKYPNGIKSENSSNTVYGNRGMKLEDDINMTCKQYKNSCIAYIYKKPTPITVTKVDYNLKSQPIIKEAFFAAPSTTDYNGLYKGYYIDFEAKETKLNSFPLKNIHPHQIEHLHNISENKGIAFLIVRFTHLSETYLLKETNLDYFIKNINRKSIPIDFFKEFAFKIKEGFNPRLDFLSIVDRIIEEDL